MTNEGITEKGPEVPDRVDPVNANPVPVQDAVRLAIPVGTAVVLAVFAALGIEGDARERFIRNQPGGVVVPFALVLIGLTLPMLLARLRSWLPPVVGGLFVLVGALYALYAGAQSISDREQPDLEITTALVAGQPGVVDVVVTGKGLSLASKDKQLMRVLAVRPAASGVVWVVCPSSAVPGRELERLNQAQLASAGPDPVRTLHWGESAPTANGETSASVSFRLSAAEFSHVCAYAALTSRRTDSADPAAVAGEERFAVSITDLRNAG